MGDRFSESYNPNAVLKNDWADRLYFLGTYLQWATPTSKLASGSKAVEEAIEVAEQAAKKSNIQANKAAGNAFRDEIAAIFESQGRSVEKEVFKRTPFGSRYIDIEVTYKGQVSGGVETKLGKARYDVTQRAKDWYLNLMGYPVNVVRKP